MQGVAEETKASDTKDVAPEGPPSYSELETNDRDRLRREATLAQVGQDITYCVHYSSLREILNSQDMADRIRRYPEGGLTHIEYLHQVPADTPQDPRNLWAQEAGPDHRRRHCHQHRRGPMGPGRNPDPARRCQPSGPGTRSCWTSTLPW